MLEYDSRSEFYELSYWIQFSNKVLNILQDSTVVEHPTDYPKIKGSNLVTRTGRENRAIFFKISNAPYALLYLTSVLKSYCTRAGSCLTSNY